MMRVVNPAIILISAAIAVCGLGVYGITTADAKITADQSRLEAGYECYAMMINEVKYSSVKGVTMRAPKLRTKLMADGKLTVGECSQLSDVVEQDKIGEIKMIYKVINEAGLYNEKSM